MVQNCAGLGGECVDDATERARAEVLDVHGGVPELLEGVNGGVQEISSEPFPQWCAACVLFIHAEAAVVEPEQDLSVAAPCVGVGALVVVQDRGRGG